MFQAIILKPENHERKRESYKKVQTTISWYFFLAKKGNVLVFQLKAKLHRDYDVNKNELVNNHIIIIPVLKAFYMFY